MNLTLVRHVDTELILTKHLTLSVIMHSQYEIWRPMDGKSFGGMADGVKYLKIPEGPTLASRGHLVDYA